MTATQAPGYEQIWVDGMNRGDVSAADQIADASWRVDVQAGGSLRPRMGPRMICRRRQR